MLIEVCIALTVLIFAILAFFIIQTLLTFQRSLHRLDHSMLDLEIRTKNLDSLLRSLSNLGDICEQRTTQLKQEFLLKSAAPSHKEKIVEDVAEWILLSASLGQKFFKRR